jgi:Holliday junction resolvasome RuvABC endonuclease subunit
MNKDSIKKVEAAKNKRSLIKKANFKILALDVATHCGWAVEGISGVWDLSIKRDESSSYRLIRFRAKLKEICEIENINLVAFERTSGQHKSSLIVQAEIHGILKVFCEDNKIEFRAFSASEIKKHATGKGNSGKPAMIAAAQEKLGYLGKDDNEADALWIYDITKKSLNI